MTPIAVEAVPAGSKPPAAGDIMYNSTGEICGFDDPAPSSTKVSPGHQKRFSYYHAEAGQTSRAVIDPGRKAIPINHSLCCSVFRTLASLGAWFYVCLRVTRRGCRTSCFRPAKR